LGKDWFSFDVGEVYLKTNQTFLGLRAELEDQLTPSWKSYWGLDSQFYWATADFQVPVTSESTGVNSPIGTRDLRTASSRSLIDLNGLYWRNEIRPEGARWVLIPGLRLSYLNVTRDLLPEPRVAARYGLDGGWTLRAASGLYHQPPLVQNVDPVYGNPALKAQRAVHGTLGFEKDFRQGLSSGWTVQEDFFYKYLYNLVVPSTAFITPSQPENFNNSGYGRAFGLESLLKYKSSGWEGWISYTLSRSTRGNSGTPEGTFQYDQTHLLTAVGDIKLNHNWKFSTRLRYATGNPFTPVVGGTFDANNDVYIPTRGSIFSERLGGFFQVDIRLDKKWIYNTWIMTAYLDIQNVTNRENPERVNYSYDYRQSGVVAGLPLLPTLGVKAEF
jgi:hypothetical protein